MYFGAVTSDLLKQNLSVNLRNYPFPARKVWVVVEYRLLVDVTGVTNSVDRVYDKKPQ